MTKESRRLVVAGLLASVMAGGASTVLAADLDAELNAMMKRSFSGRGIAGIDRLNQDESNLACSQSEGKPLTEAKSAAIQAASLATVKPPSDGNYLGDWRVGERLAQNGRGMTWSDKSTDPAANGGSCYNCHEIGKAEISHGTIGPSLLNYGKLRGVSDPASAAAKPIIDYTWAKLYNAKAFNACSGMPRFGHTGMLDEKQLKDLMALLLDPASPVNK